MPLTTPEPTFEKGVWMGLKNDSMQDISYEGILRCYEEGNALLGKYTPKLVSVHDPDEYLAAASSPKDREERFANIIDAYKALLKLKRRNNFVSIHYTKLYESAAYMQGKFIVFSVFQYL